MEETFTCIYDKKRWGSKDGKGRSGNGDGLTPDNKWYNKTLMKHLSDTNSKTICDIGCGDWEVSKYADWNGYYYMGIDCVKSVIEENIKNYAGKCIAFRHQDASITIPEGFDFVILKDVIQHWDSEIIAEVLPQLIKKNRYVFLGNGYMFGRDRTKNDWKTRTIDRVYKYHPVDITKEPLCHMNLNVIDIQHKRFKEFILISSSCSASVSSPSLL